MDNPKILIVEDENDTLETLGRFFDRNGFITFLAKDGEEAYKIVKSVLPDVVITDILMPRMDGNQLIHKIHDDSLGKKVAVIVITARKNMEDYFKQLGVDDFIAKPFTPEQILKSVQSILQKHSQAPVARATRRVLVAGSHDKDVEKMTGQLREEGCHVDFVTSGSQVISKAVMFLPHVIILEAEIYDLPSHELVSILRQMPQFKKNPIIIYRRSKMVGPPNEYNQDEEVHMGVLVERCLEKSASAHIGHYDPKTFKDQISKYIFMGAIVLIDDDKGVTRLIRNKVENLGYKVYAAPDGASGLDFIRKINPSLILLDVVMPGMDGYKVLEIVKKDPLLHAIPVIMVTIKGQDDEVQKGLALGADDYVIKPFCMELLLKKIESAIPFN